MLAILYRWTFSPTHVLGGGLVLLLLAGFVYLRNMKRQPGAIFLLLLLRCGFIVALTWLLMGPSEQPQANNSPQKPSLLIFLDTSRSMLTEDVRGESRIRFALNHWLNESQLAALREQFDVQLMRFDAETVPLPANAFRLSAKDLATGSSSNIAYLIRAAMIDLATGGGSANALIISDGHDSQAEPLTTAATMARTRGVSIHTATLGGSSLQRDLSLNAFAEQKFLIAKEPGRIVVNLRNVGFDQPSGQLSIQGGLSTNSAKSEAKTQLINFGNQPAVRVYLPIREEKPGLYEYVVSLTPAEGEVETGNNTQRVFVEVTAEPFNVLVLEGEPYWDTKFLAQSLRTDARIALTHITQITPGKQAKIVTRSKAQGPVNIPTTAEELAAYDVVILGRAMERIISPRIAALFPAYVQEHGGHVVFARGKAYDPDDSVGRQIMKALAVIEPVEWGEGVRRNQALVLTPIGNTAPCFAFGALKITPNEALDALRGFHLMPAVLKEKVSAEVWARASSGPSQPNDRTLPPAIVSMKPGRGSVVAILGEGLWRWAQLPPDQKRYDGMYDVFWSNLVRSLAMGGSFQPGDQVSLDLSSTTIRQGQAVRITVATRIPPPAGYQPSITIVDPNGKEHQPSLRRLIGGTRHQLEFIPNMDGVHSVALDASPLQPSNQMKKLAVFSEDIERLDSSADPVAMRSLAELTGGIAFSADQFDELLDSLKRFEAAKFTPVEPDYVWNKGIILFLLLGWIGIEWLLRRSVGML